MKKTFYKGHSRLELSQILMYKICYDYVKAIVVCWKSKVVLYGYTHFHFNIKTDDIYKDIAEDVETKFDHSNYELDRPLPRGQNKKYLD